MRLFSFILSPVVAMDNNGSWIAARCRARWLFVVLAASSIIPGCYSGVSEKTYSIGVSLWPDVPRELERPGVRAIPAPIAICGSSMSGDTTHFRFYPIRGQIDGTKAFGYEVVPEGASREKAVFRILAYDIRDRKGFCAILKGESQVEWLLDINPEDVVTYVDRAGRAPTRVNSNRDLVLRPGTFHISVERKRKDNSSIQSLSRSTGKES